MQRKFFLTLTIILSAMTFSTTAAAQQKFSVYLSGRQVVPANNSPGSGTCMVTLNAPQTQVSVECTYRNLSSNVVGAHIHDNGPVGVNGSIRFDFSFTGGRTGATTSPLTFNTTPAQVADLRANRWYVDVHTSNFPDGEIRGQVKRANIPADYDGDGRTDLVVYRQLDRTFYTLNSLENNITASIPVGRGFNDQFVNNMGDFDGDGRADYVMYNLDEFNNITWFILQSETNTVRVVRWGTFRGIGTGSDEFTPADYDGDGKLDVAVFRRATGVWYIIESSTGNPRYEYWGAPGDFPIIGDYDGDGKADVAVVRNQGGLLFWYIRNSSNGQMQVFNWGLATDNLSIFFPIDIDNDGKHDAMVRRAVNGQVMHFVRRSSDGQMYNLAWGALTLNFPLYGDYDGDGKTDFVARQQLIGGSGQYRWHIFQSATQTHRAVDFGQFGDLLHAEEEEKPQGKPRELPVSDEYDLKF